MTKVLVKLLGVDKGKFKEYVDRLEYVCLRPGVDIRLGAEVVTKSRDKIKSLGLDVADTTPKELFFALKHRLIADEKALNKQLGIKKGMSDKNTQRVADTVSRLSGREKSISLTPAGIKRILKAVPPKKTMKALRYKSLESVLKREDPKVLYGLACLIENESWHSQVHAKIRRLNSKDIQWQQVSTQAVPRKWYEKLEPLLTHKGALFVNEEAGVVCLLPVVDASHSGSSVLMLGLAMQAVTSVSTASLPYRKMALAQGYSSVIPQLANGDHPVLRSIHGLTPSWQIVHELVSKDRISIAGSESELEVFEMFWEDTETRLASIVDSMDFWVGTHYLGVASEKSPVSLHVLDVAIYILTGAEYGTQQSAHMELALWNELQSRYLAEDVLSKSLVNQLSDVL